MKSRLLTKKAIMFLLVFMIALIATGCSGGGSEAKLASWLKDYTRTFYRPETFRCVSIHEFTNTGASENELGVDGKVHIYLIDYMCESKGGSVVDRVVLVDANTGKCYDDNILDLSDPYVAYNGAGFYLTAYTKSTILDHYSSTSTYVDMGNQFVDKVNKLYKSKL